jgi:peptidyl-dipeptidase Dcp
MIRQFLFATAALAIVATSPAQAAAGKARGPARASAGLPASNPFATPSVLPFQSPDFSKIKSSDYLPALLAGIAEQKAEIARIANNPAPPNFANTVIAMERSGQLFERVNLAFQAVKGANSDPVLEDADTKASPLWAPEYSKPDYIFLNQKLFQRFKTLHEHKAELNLNPEQARLLDIYYGQFVHAGAELPAAKQVALKALNKRITSLETGFTQKLRAAAKAGAAHFDDASALAGLSPEQLAAAQEAAKDRKLSGYVLPLQNTTQQPALASLSSHDTRQKLFEASLNRAEHGDANDTRAIVSEIALLRAQKAALFGAANWADYTLYDQMAKDRATAIGFLDRLAPAVSAKERLEWSDILALAKSQGATFQPTAADWNFYAEQIRKQRYAIDADQLKQYFEFNKVLTDGVFYAANQLYGITFKERHDIPTWSPDMRVFQVYDTDGKELALFMIDPWKRDNKNGGAWMDNLVKQSTLRGTKPVVYNVENFTKPAPGQPALISWDDVTTMFHEFGHALHGMFAAQTYPKISGADTARDFVEFPSQFNENWALDPKVLSHYAVNYKTGQPIPQDLVDKIKRSRTFNQGYELGEVLEAARLDLDWHSLPATAPRQDVDRFEAQALATGGFDTKDVPPRYRSSYFLHIWSNGYSAGYYAYPWTRMLGQDAFAWFQANGGLTRANGQRFRDMVLSRGNTMDYAEMYRAFAGHDPEIQPYLDFYGLSGGAAPATAPGPVQAPAAPAPKKGERG